MLGSYDDKLAGKVIIDITNPVDFSTFSPLQVLHMTLQQPLGTGFGSAVKFLS